MSFDPIDPLGLWGDDYRPDPPPVQDLPRDNPLRLDLSGTEAFDDAGYDNLPMLVQWIAEAAVDSAMAAAGWEGTPDGGYSRWGGPGARNIPGDYDEPLDRDDTGGFAVPDVQGMFNDWYQSLWDLFEPWSDLPDPAGFKSDLHALSHGIHRITDEASGSFSSVGNAGDGTSFADPNASALFKSLDTRAGQLQGHAFMTFYEKYVAALPGVVSNCRLLMVAVGAHINGEATLMAATRANVVDIAKKARWAMMAARPDHGGDDATIAIAVIGAVLSGAAAFATGGTSIALSLAATGTGLLGSLWPSSAPAQKDPIPLGGATPDAVFNNLSDALNELNSSVKDEEKQIRDAVNRTIAYANNNPADFDLKTPTLFGDKIGEIKRVRGNRPTIHELSHGLIPDVAGHLRGASRSLAIDSAPWRKDGQIGLGTEGPFWDVQALADGAITELNDLVSELGEAAAILDVVWKSFDHTDAWAQKRLTTAEHTMYI